MSDIKALSKSERYLQNLDMDKLVDSVKSNLDCPARMAEAIAKLISKPELGVRVDNSLNPSIGDHKLDAMDELNRLHSLIGQKSYDLLEYVCGLGNTIRQMNESYKFTKAYGGARFREALDETAIFYGLKDKGNTIRGNKKR